MTDRAKTAVETVAHKKDTFLVSYNKIDGVKILDDTPRGTKIIYLSINQLDNNKLIEQGKTVYLLVDMIDYATLLVRSMSTVQWRRY